jgi:hypothetical protein
MIIPNPETEPPKPVERAMSNPFPPIKDTGIRLVMIPLFGLGIPHLTGYFGPLGPADVKYWAGLAWSLLIAFTIWQGNRFFLLKQRQHFDWFRHAGRKIVALAFACVFYTAPVVVLMMLGWYRYAGFGPDWEVIRTITLTCVICVAFVTHVYETVYLIQQREGDLLTVERTDRARTQAELDALRAQVAPHFLFNSLNTLSWLIRNDSTKALEFTQDLAEVYRYILRVRRSDLITLDEECAFVRQFFRLLKLRFENSLQLELPTLDERQRAWQVIPLSLQLPVENAVKHNEHSASRPLRIEIRIENGFVIVTNEKRLRSTLEPVSRLGLRTLDERSRLVLGRGIEVSDTGVLFSVGVPVSER